MIAALPKAPSRINPITSPERALERRNYVLSRMLELDISSRRIRRPAVAAPDRCLLPWRHHGDQRPLPGRNGARTAGGRAGHGSLHRRLLGLHHRETPRCKLAANQALRNGLEEYDRRHGYRGPEATHRPGRQATDSGLLDEALSPFQPLAGLAAGAGHPG